MRRAELLRKITTLPLTASKLAEDILTGGYRSVFRGEGIEFNEVRMYQQGDDARAIDRNVSARFGRPYIKLYREEREFTVCAALDCSASMFCGTSGELSRFEQAVLTTALVGLSAERAGQRFGAILFDKTNRHIYRPRHGHNYAMAIVSAALDARAEEKGSGLREALSGLQAILKRRSLVVIVSDFWATGWEQELAPLCHKHDCIAVRIHDPLETDFPPAGLLPVEDPESGRRLVAPSNQRTFRDSWTAWNSDHAALWASICRRAGCAALEISTTDEAAVELSKFFRPRH